MKKTVCILILLLAFPLFAACGSDDEPATRTAAFFAGIGEDSFWYQSSVLTSDGESYGYIQAVVPNSVTTIEDRSGESDDVYVIYTDGLLHSLNLKNKKYDTKKTDDGVNFLFANNSPQNFNDPKSTDEYGVLNGEYYYCETFDTVDKNGDAAGENVFYFEGTRLVAIEWYTNGKLSVTMMIEDYSNDIPDEIYTSVPEDFKAGTFTAETVIPPDSRD